MATNKTTHKKKHTPVAREIGSAQDSPTLLAEVKERIQAVQYAALRSVNKGLVGPYWSIGQLIVDRQ